MQLSREFQFGSTSRVAQLLGFSPSWEMKILTHDTWQKWDYGKSGQSKNGKIWEKGIYSGKLRKLWNRGRIYMQEIWENCKLGGKWKYSERNTSIRNSILDQFKTYKLLCSKYLFLQNLFISLFLFFFKKKKFFSFLYSDNSIGSQKSEKFAKIKYTSHYTQNGTLNRFRRIRTSILPFESSFCNFL